MRTNLFGLWTNLHKFVGNISHWVYFSLRLFVQATHFVDYWKLSMENVRTFFKLFYFNLIWETFFLFERFHQKLNLAPVASQRDLIKTLIRSGVNRCRQMDRNKPDATSDIKEWFFCVFCVFFSKVDLSVWCFQPSKVHSSPNSAPKIYSLLEKSNKIFVESFTLDPRKSTKQPSSLTDIK